MLTEYSDSMKKLLKKGTYTGGKRPSEHQIGVDSFLTDNGGAIPPNVIVPPDADECNVQAVLPIANTASITVTTCSSAPIRNGSRPRASSTRWMKIFRRRWGHNPRLDATIKGPYGPFFVSPNQRLSQQARE